MAIGVAAYYILKEEEGVTTITPKAPEEDSSLTITGSTATVTSTDCTDGGSHSDAGAYDLRNPDWALSEEEKDEADRFFEALDNPPKTVKPKKKKSKKKKTKKRK